MFPWLLDTGAVFVNQLVQQPWVLEESTSQQKPTFRPGRDIYANIYIYLNIFFIGIQYQYVIQDQDVNLGGLF